MALAERSRAVLHRKLTEVVGHEEAVTELMASLPSPDAERPATEAFVRTEIAGVRAEVLGVRADLGGLEARLVSLIHTEVRSAQRWTISALIGLRAATVAALAMLT